MITLKYDGSGVRHTHIQVPGWAGTASNDTFQPWHYQPFMDAAESCVELVFQGSKCQIDLPIPAPFVSVNNETYSLNTQILFRTPENHNLLVLPHPKCYADPEAPVAVMSSVQYDWWYKPLTVFFRNPGGCPTLFRPDEPYALVIPIRRQSVHLAKMLDEEVEKIRKADSSSKDKYLTRNDNEYNVMANLAEINQLPEEVMERKRTIKPRLIKRK